MQTLVMTNLVVYGRYITTVYLDTIAFSKIIYRACNYHKFIVIFLYMAEIPRNITHDNKKF